MTQDRSRAPGPDLNPQEMLDQAARALGWRTDWACGNSPVTWGAVLDKIDDLQQLIASIRETLLKSNEGQPLRLGIRSLQPDVAKLASLTARDLIMANERISGMEQVIDKLSDRCAKLRGDVISGQQDAAPSSAQDTFTGHLWPGELKICCFKGTFRDAGYFSEPVERRFSTTGEKLFACTNSADWSIEHGDQIISACHDHLTRMLDTRDSSVVTGIRY